MIQLERNMVWDYPMMSSWMLLKESILVMRTTMLIIPEMDPRSIRICYNENPLGPSPLAITAMQNQVPASNLYPSWSNSSIRSALATQYGLSEDNFIFGAGASEIIHLAADAYLDPGEELIWADPSYGQMPAEARKKLEEIIDALRDYL